MPLPADYEKQVYTSLTGKVIGVYLGRPFEGYTRERIKERWGNITGYVHEDQNVPLIVADDDISGTLTFIRTLEDSGLYQDTPDDFYGKTWLNYLLENQTVLWWGGVCNSTEHTAFDKLKRGIPSPLSGSMQMNGKIVAEQIGAQIFIDAYGMVCPANPELAVKLAKKAASVSHDGEAVYAAMTVAAMISIAFEEKCMDTILDKAIQYIPADSKIAEIHRTVRQWAAEDKDWEKTYDRINEKYGYHIYGGNCHVIPNHAIMVMAWAYSGNDFYKAMSIICSAGWDTDCNAANVGSVSALVAGLENLDKDYDFRSPMADRILLPSADGTYSAADVFQQQLHIAAIGRKIMGEVEFPAPKNGVWQSFEMPGALHGYQSDESKYESRGKAKLCNDKAPIGFSGARCLVWDFQSGKGICSRIQTPVTFADNTDSVYNSIGTPRLYNGMDLIVKGRCESGSGDFTICMITVNPDVPPAVSEIYHLEAGQDFEIHWKINCYPQYPIKALAFQIHSQQRTDGRILIDYVDCSGSAELAVKNNLYCRGARSIYGWISNLDFIRGWFSDDNLQQFYLGSNDDLGIMATGNRYWTAQTLECDFKIHGAAEKAGILMHYQGVLRHYAVVFSHGKLQIVRQYYGQQVLAEIPYILKDEEVIHIKVTRNCPDLQVEINGQAVLAVQDNTMDCGGCGFMISHGLCGFDDLKINAHSK